ncbi:MAG: hypothetical protein ACJ8F1_09825 [Polyangia bacterium]
MTRALVTAGALVLAFVAGRAISRRRAVLLLGRHGRALAPAAVASVWLVGLLLGQLTGSVTGMSWVAAAAVVALWAVLRRRFPPLRIRVPRWTQLDWAMFLFVAVVFWSVDLWDLDTHRALTAQLLHGNLPPRALNDPRFPLAYHAVYDALVAIVVTVLPIDLQPAMGMVSTACVALTLANLQALSRVFFRRHASAQLARALFMFGFGPVFIRCVASGWNLAEMHGRTAQSYVELILRRPAGLGMAFFTLALAVVLPCYGRGASRDAAISRLKWLVPTLLVLPQMSEEATFFLFVYLAPLVLARRLSARTIVVLVAATVVGALQSGVVLGVLGHRSMATPTLHLSFPPRLPTWAFEQTGVSLFSREAGGFYTLELGPVFLAALAFALIGRDAGRRAVGGAFLAGVVIAVFASTGAWKKSDLDRFLFYGTPPVFMLAAALPDRIFGAVRGGRTAPASLLAGFGLVVCAPTTVYPAWQAGNRLTGEFYAHAVGGDLRRTLDAVGAREPILTTLDRANDVIMAGFLVIAPIETNEVTRVTPALFDDYVRANARRAVWLFLPEGDPRLAGRRPVARDAGYVLARVAGPTAPR